MQCVMSVSTVFSVVMYLLVESICLIYVVLCLRSLFVSV